MKAGAMGAWAILGVTLVLTPLPGTAGTVHVRSDGDDAASGAAWAQATRTVQHALDRATPGDEVWVAAGTYTQAIRMKPGVGLYGGFRGTETSREQRDWIANPTLLDGGDTNVVLWVEGGGPDTVVDGFTLQRGAGCGVRLYDSGATVSHNRIRWNRSSASLAYGAGISIRNLGTGVAPVIRGNVILDNYAFDGGGIACIDTSPLIIGNTIAWNTAVQNGGGISCWRDASPRIENNAIFGNTASWVQGASAVPVGGGGVFATADDLDGRPHPTARSSPILLSNVIAANGAAHGGGVVLIDANGGVPRLLNNTIVANSGSGILWGSSALVPIAPVLINNLVAFNPWGLEQMPGTPTNAVIEHNCVFGNRVHTAGADYRGLPDRTGRDGNISADPLLAALRLGNLHLQPDSPCRDAGKALGTDLGPEDVEGEPRIQGAAVDIGADESSGVTWTVVPRVIRVTPGGDDTQDGASWSAAKRTVAAALDAVRSTGGEVWVAAGTYAGHFWLPAFAHLYGGFAGTEAAREQRAPGVHPSVLDGGGKPNVVLSGQGGFAVSTLDGFTITGGGVYTGGNTLNKYGLGGKGGGILISVSSPVITNNVITRNSLAYDNTTNQFVSHGAGIACELSYAVIGGNTLLENEILNDFDGSGAGIYCLQSMPLIVGNRIEGNQAVYGAAIYAWASSPLIVGNTITNNSMYVRMPLFRGAAEGAISIHLADDALVEGNHITANTAGTGAGLYFAAYRAGRVQNNLMVANHAYDPTAFGGMGGAMYLFVTTNAASPIQVLNNTLVGNVASNFLHEMGGGIAFTLVPPATNLVIANNLVVFNSSGLYQTPTTPMPTPALSHNNVFSLRENYLGLVPGPTDVSRATTFVNPATGDYRLAPGDPAIDAADPNTVLAADLEGVPRPLDGDANGQAMADQGAFEYVHPTADTDGDELPDAWEVTMRTAALRPDAEEDPDADLAGNTAEYLAGTHPRDPRSVLALRADPLPGGVLRLRWAGVGGRLYTLEHASHLGPPSDWTVSQAGILGHDTEITLEVHLDGGAPRFYRVLVANP